MRLSVLALCAATLATACTEVTQAVDGAAREGAKGVITQTIATRFPQVPKALITPFTDCIVDYATADEVREFVRAAAVGVDDTTVAAVRGILARPDTQTCLQARTLENGLG